MERAHELHEWARENDLREDPRRIVKLYDEARRRWGHVMSRLRIGQVVAVALELSHIS